MTIPDINKRRIWLGPGAGPGTAFEKRHFLRFVDYVPFSNQESPEKVRKNKSSDGDVLHKKGMGKPATTRDAGTLTRAANTEAKAIQVSLPGNELLCTLFMGRPEIRGRKSH